MQATGRASFSVDATDDVGMQRVLVTYDLGDGRLGSITLTYGAASERWRGVLALSSGERVTSYFVQAVDEAGNVASSDNKGLFFAPMTYRVDLPMVIKKR